MNGVKFFMFLVLFIISGKIFGQTPFCDQVQFEAPSFLKSSFLDGNFKWIIEVRDIGTGKVEKYIQYTSESTSNFIKATDYPGKQIQVSVSRGGFISQPYSYFVIEESAVLANNDSTFKSSKYLNFYNESSNCYSGSVFDFNHAIDLPFTGQLYLYDKDREIKHSVTFKVTKDALTDPKAFPESLIIDGLRLRYTKLSEESKTITFFQFNVQGSTRCTDLIKLQTPSSETEDFLVTTPKSTLISNTFASKVEFPLDLSGGNYTAYTGETPPSYTVVEVKLNDVSVTSWQNESDDVYIDADNKVTFSAPEIKKEYTAVPSESDWQNNVEITYEACTGAQASIKLTAKNPPFIYAENPVESHIGLDQATGSISYTIDDGSSEGFSTEHSLSGKLTVNSSECSVNGNISGNAISFDNLSPGEYSPTFIVVDEAQQLQYEYKPSLTSTISFYKTDDITYFTQDESYYGAGDGEIIFQDRLIDGSNIPSQFSWDGGKDSLQFLGRKVMNLVPGEYTNWTVNEYAGACNDIISRSFYKNNVTINIKKRSQIAFETVIVETPTYYSSDLHHYQTSIQVKTNKKILGDHEVRLIHAKSDGTFNFVTYDHIENEQAVFSNLLIDENYYIVAFDRGPTDALNPSNRRAEQYWYDSSSESNINTDLISSDKLSDWLVDPSTMPGYLRFYTENGAAKVFRFANPEPFALDDYTVHKGTNHPFDIICNGEQVAISAIVNVPDDRLGLNFDHFRWTVSTARPESESIPYSGLVEFIPEDKQLRLLDFSVPALDNYQIYLTENIEDFDQAYYGYPLLDPNELFNISQPAQITTAIEINSAFDAYQVSRYDGTDGAVKVKANGGVPAYAVHISGVTNSQDITADGLTTVFQGLSHGTYGVDKVIDAQSCETFMTEEGKAEVTLTAPDSLSFEAVTSDYGLSYQISQHGGDDGSISITAANGIPNYTFELYQMVEGNWQLQEAVNNGGSPYTFSTLTAGDYLAVVYDQFFVKPSVANPEYWQDDEYTRGDVVMQPISLKEPDPLSIDTFVVTNYGAHLNENYHVKAASGALARTGEVNFTISGGIPTKDENNNELFYSLTILDGDNNSRNLKLMVTDNGVGSSSRFQVSSDQKDFPAGALSFKVEDRHSYFVETAFVLMAPPALEISYLAPQKPGCIGDEDGQLAFHIQGGIPFIENGKKYYEVALGGSTAYRIVAGEVAFLKTSDEESFTMGQGETTLIFKDRYNAPYGGLDFTAYEAAWLNEDDKSPWPAWTMDDTSYQNLETSWVKAVKTFDENAASALPYIMPNHPPVQLLADVYTTICDDSADGKIQIKSIYGGSGAAYQLYFAGGTEAIDFSPDVLISDVLLAGNYAFEVSFDQCNTASPADYTISKVYDGHDNRVVGDTLKRNDELVAVLATAPITATVQFADHLCFGEATGGVQVVDIAGGHAPFDFQLDRKNDSNREQWDLILKEELLSGSSWQGPTNLKAGDFALTLLDRQGCLWKEDNGQAISEAREEYVVEETSTANFSLMPATSPVSCTGATDGQISLANFQLVKPTTFVWIREDGQRFGEQTLTVDTHPYEVQALAAGRYQLFLQEQGCSERYANIEAVVEISPAVAFMDSLSVGGNSCEGFDIYGQVNLAGGELFLGHLQSDNSVQWSSLGTWGISAQGKMCHIDFPGRYQLKYVKAAGCNEVISEVKDLNSEEYTFALEKKNGQFDLPCAGELAELTFGPVLNEHTNIPASAAFTYELKKLSDGTTSQNTSGTFRLLPDEYELRAWYEMSGCPIYGQQFSFTVSAPAPLALRVEDQNIPIVVSCMGAELGKIIGNITGGSAPFTLTYYIKEVQHQLEVTEAGPFEISGLPVGYSYQLLLEDAAGCSQAQAQPLYLPYQAPQANIQAIAADYCQQASGEAVINIEHGVGPFILKLDEREVARFAENQWLLQGLEAGKYDYVLEDMGVGQCPVALSVEIAASPQAFEVEVAVLQAPACEGADGRLALELKDRDGQALSWNDFTLLNAPEHFDPGMGILSALEAKAYVFEVIENSRPECVERVEFYLAAKEAPQISSWSVVDLPYCDQPVGSVKVELQGGTGVYEWIPEAGLSLKDAGSAYFEISGLQVDKSYALQFRDQSGNCPGIANVVINAQQVGHVFGPLQTSITPSSCGQTLGAIQLEDLDTNIYQPLWLINESNENKVEGLAAGTYALQLLHLPTGCDTTYWFTVGERSPLDIQWVAQVPADCGKASGEIEVRASGGGESFTYSWRKDNFELAENSGVLKQAFAGQYSVIAQDQYGCVSEPLAIRLEDRPGLEVGINVLSLASCPEVADGKALALVQGGLAPYEYYWNGQAGAVQQEDLTAGTVHLQVVDAAGCAMEAAPVQMFARPELKFSLSHSMPTCTEAADGEASVVILNRQPEEIRTIQWKDHDGQLLAVGEAIHGLADGTYALEIIENSGCSQQQAFEMKSAAGMEIVSITTTAPKCPTAADGGARFQIQGGSGQYFVEWYALDHQQLVGTDFQLSGVPAGAYQLRVMDQQQSACMVASDFEILPPMPLEIIQIEKTIPSCYGLADGSILISIQGGKAPYKVFWPEIGQAGARATQLPVGQYTVNIEDQNGCQLSQQITFDQQPTALQVNTQSVDPASCRFALDGAIALDIAGGIPDYQVSWSNGRRGASINGLGKGMYQALVQDANRCRADLMVEVLAPELLTAEVLEGEDPSCPAMADGRMLLQPAGGTAPYEVVNLPPDAEAVWNSQLAAFEISGLMAGQYYWEIRDAQQCEARSAAYRLYDPAPLTFTSVQYQQPDCHGGADGAIAVSVAGGSGAYLFDWENGQQEAEAVNLSAGTYKLTVADALKGCRLQNTFTLEEPAPLGIVINTQNPACHDDANGQIVALAEGGTPGYYFQWAGQPAGAQISGLTAGDYDLLVTDAHGCQATGSTTLTNPEAVVLAIDGLSDFMEICEGTTLRLDAGAAWKTVRWISEERGLDFSSRQISLTEAGAYQVRVTNQKDCPASQEFQLELVDDLLAAEFLVQSSPEEAFQTYMLVDITYPEPTQISWDIQPAVDIIHAEEHQQEIRFRESGLHVITLTSRQENCMATRVKEVEVVRLTNGRYAVDTGEGLPEDEIFHGTYFTVSPNPSDGRFDIDIQLEQIEDIYLSLQQVGEGKILWSENFKNQDYYHYRLEMPTLGSGIYVLRMMAPSGNKAIKILIK
ncbi:hypothetical protein PEDI_36360 [Persicobacter diffluens]|uniref:Uncharacterized protein n=1 Tax=Persicobacter diffluens TaxID=981 RepID=A0AAN5ALB7_9BACT|nr:hypothetical protein PEDI_36360 [Persicobacter diffluens]